MSLDFDQAGTRKQTTDPFLLLCSVLLLNYPESPLAVRTQSEPEGMDDLCSANEDCTRLQAGTRLRMTGQSSNHDFACWSCLDAEQNKGFETAGTESE